MEAEGEAGARQLAILRSTSSTGPPTGCRAGRHEEARAYVYRDRDRILRGAEFYSTKKLGADGADLGAVA